MLRVVLHSLLLLTGLLSLSLPKVHADSSISFVVPLLTPYAYYTEEGRLTGTQVELIKKINRTTDLKIDVYPVPVSRLMLTWESGKSDLAVLTESKKSNELGEKIAFITQPKFMIVSLKSAKQVSAFSQLNDQTVGYLSSSFYGEEFAKNTEMNKVPILDNVKALNMLMLKRIDYLATSERGLVYLLNEQKVFEKVVPQFVFHQSNAYVYLSKKSKHYAMLKSELTPLLQAMDNQGVLKDIIDKWTFDDSTMVANGKLQ